MQWARDTLSSFRPQNIQGAMSSRMTQVGEFGANAGRDHQGQPTLENLVHAVSKMHVDHVEHLLHAGVDPNLPIDKEGHTVLDAYAKAVEHMLKEIIGSRTPAAQKTRVFFANQENARRVFELLISHGAKMSTPEMQRNRGAYVS
mmetsp:Transcript_26659/g.41523  ORF Transcript_26659/g.41523 Transcript_26659/m.41523 type:complete len:145 (+) Transcript_26659:62-496(+)